MIACADIFVNKRKVSGCNSCNVLVQCKKFSHAQVSKVYLFASYGLRAFICIGRSFVKK